jgi:hypothetical protein
MLALPPSDMFRDELEMFADTIATGTPGELTADNGNVALAVVYAALRSIERHGQAVKIADMINETKSRI